MDAKLKSSENIEHRVARLHDAHEPYADERTEDHNTFQRQIDDTAALGKYTGERHDHQGNCVNKSLLDQKGHGSSSPFVSAASGAAA